jgi:acetyl esterase/lipase
MGSEQARVLAELFASTRERFSKPDLDLATVRDICESLHAAGSEPAGVTYAEVSAGGVPALWCIPEDCREDRVLLHNHAGGAVVFSMYSDRKAAGHLAKAAGARALVLDYRRAPESKFPAQTEDVETAYRWLLDQGLSPDSIASMGQSIGGNFAVSLALTLRDKGVPPPAAILSISPWYDMELKNRTVASNAETDKLLSQPLLESFRDAWLGGTGVRWQDPRVNMLYAADLAGLPPTTVYYGEYELLAGEAVEFVNHARGAGVNVSLHCLPEGQHNFILGSGRVPEVDKAIDDMGRWLRSQLTNART